MSIDKAVEVIRDIIAEKRREAEDDFWARGSAFSKTGEEIEALYAALTALREKCSAPSPQPAVSDGLEWQR